MSEDNAQEHLLFVLARPSRADEVQTEGDSDASLRRALEETWAASVGVDLAQLRASESATECTSPLTTTGATLAGTTTTNPDDVTTDNKQDDKTVTTMDDIKNDGGTQTGGILDIPV